MRRIHFAVSVLALAGGAATLFAQPAPLDTQFGERVEVDLVNVEVYVTDKGGHPVSGLQRGDFTLLEDGKPMSITNFAAVDRSAIQPEVRPAAPATAVQAPAAAGIPDPLHLVLFIDNSHITAAHRNRVLRQVREFLSRRLAAGDPVMLVTWDPGLHVRLPFTTDREALAKALDDQAKAATMNRDTSRSFAMRQIQEIREVSLAMQMAELKAQRGNDKGGDIAEDSRHPETDTACPPEIAQPARDYAQEARNEVLRSIQGLTVLINSLSGLPSRKALLHVSDGLPATPGEDMFEVLNLMCKDASALATLVYRGDEAMIDAQSYSVVKQWDEVASHASAQQVTLYTLQATGLENTLSSVTAEPGEEFLRAQTVGQIERENRRASLTLLATSTGGRAVLDANDLAADLARIEDDLGHYYSLGYQPPHTGDGREHRITVKIRRPDARARYRQHYRDKPALERAVDHTLASLYYGYQDNPLDVQLEVGDMVPDGKGNWAVPFRLRIPLYKVTMQQTETSFEGKVQLLVASQTDGKKTPLRQVKVPIKIPRLSALTALGQYYQYEVKLILEPGEQNVAIAVRDEASTTTSFLARNLKLGVPGDAAPAR
ncbi:MAG TPA: VWA domain-containing protein [Thermoanaerobaculia bacterium]|nr:VWA domain-containing protein [Thermoanaerobaculia bacterium]